MKSAFAYLASSPPRQARNAAAPDYPHKLPCAKLLGLLLLAVLVFLLAAQPARYQTCKDWGNLLHQTDLTQGLGAIRKS
jgi:hypothetical protein